MANMRRWDPFNEMLTLRDAMNQLLEDSFVSPARTAGREGFAMPMDVSETVEAYVVDAALPGVKPEDLDITIQDNVLSIRGETRNEAQTGDQQTNFHLKERRYGQFSRTISLPAAVDADAVRASLENGILHLEIPKADEVKPRKITVNGGREVETQALEVNR